MNKYYLTFGVKYPWRNGWVEVIAPDYKTARNMVVDIFGDRWAFLYEEKDLNRSYFPAGKIGETIK